MADPQPIENRVLQLEELLTHQEHVVQQLDAVIVKMQGELRRLEAKYDEQMARITWKLQQPPEVRDPIDEKPPHY